MKVLLAWVVIKTIIIEIEGNRNYYENEIDIMKMMQSWKYRNATWYV